MVGGALKPPLTRERASLALVSRARRAAQDESSPGVGGEWWADDGGGDDEAIYELRDDETGHLFYFNCATGVSSWEAPEWVDEVDPASGAVYYVNSLTGETQWDVPFEFIPVVREEVYSTPQASFIKTMLSPKRSRGPRNFYSADVR